MSEVFVSIPEELRVSTKWRHSDKTARATGGCQMVGATRRDSTMASAE